MEHDKIEEYELHVFKMFRKGKVYADYKTSGFNRPRRVLKGFDTYLMLDYNDFLYHKKLEGDEQNYSAFLGTKDIFRRNPVQEISTSINSIYRKAGQPQDIFNINAQEKGLEAYLSEFPLLGIIQIHIMPGYFRSKKSVCPQVEEFMEECEQDIDALAQKQMGSHGRYAIYRAVTMGEFCLVVRTDTFKDIFDIAMNIGKSYAKIQEDTDKEKRVCRYSTYTNVGIECIEGKKGFLTFSEKFINTHGKDKIALRLVVDKSIREILESCFTDLGVKGLLGRYDYIIYLDFNQFAELYPVLCSYKSGVLEGGATCFDKEEARKQADQSLSQFFTYILTCKNLHGINERVLISLESGMNEIEMDTPVDNYYGTAEEEKELFTEVCAKNSELLRKVERLRDYAKYFNNCHRYFWDAYREFEELVKTYGGLGYEMDSRLNWKMFIDLIDVILKNMAEYSALLEKAIEKKNESDKKDIQNAFIQSLKLSTEALNQYAKLLQGMNQQTIQAPSYEIRMKIDAEKSIIAYGEYMRRYLVEYAQYPWGSVGADEVCGDQRPQIYPIIYPDLLVKKVEVLSPFHLELERNLPGGSQEDERKYIIICKIPSYDYFGKLYKMLPWVAHEVSHHILILRREERNGFLIRQHLGSFFEKFVHCWFENNSKGVLGLYSYHVEHEFAEALTGYFVEKFMKYHDQWVEYQLEYLKSQLDMFIDRLRDVIAGRQEHVERSAAYGDLLKELADFSDRYTALGKEEIIRLLEVCKGEETYAREDLENMIQALLASMAVHLEKMIGALIEKPEENIPKNSYTFETEDLGACGFEQFENLISKKYQSIADKKTGKFMKTLTPYLKEYFYGIKILYGIYRKSILLEDAVWSEEVLNAANADTMMGELQGELKNKLERFKDSTAKEAYYCGEDITRTVNRMGVDFSDSASFKESFQESMCLMDMRDFQEWGDRVFREYREICADLTMCQSIGLRAYGYFQFVLDTFAGFDTSETKVDEQSVDVNRMKIVMAVLLATEEQGQCNPTFEDGRADITFHSAQREEIENSLLYQVEEMEARVRQRFNKFTLGKHQSWSAQQEEGFKICFSEISNNVSKIYEIMEGQIDEARGIWVDALDELCGPYFKDELDPGFTFEFMGNHREEMVRAFNEERHILFKIKAALQVLYTIVIDEKITVDKNYFDHAKKYYEKAGGGKSARCIWEKNVQNQERESVRRYYNDPEYYKNCNPAQKLCHTIKFIQDYYYINRLS